MPVHSYCRSRYFTHKNRGPRFHRECLNIRSILRLHICHCSAKSFWRLWPPRPPQSRTAACPPSTDVPRSQRARAARRRWQCVNTWWRSGGPGRSGAAGLTQSQRACRTSIRLLQCRTTCQGTGSRCQGTPSSRPCQGGPPCGRPPCSDARGDTVMSACCSHAEVGSMLCIRLGGRVVSLSIFYCAPACR